MQQYRKLNNLTGWAVFLVAAVVYVCCIEPTASFWDCGEYIACSYGLETGHPPGAPFFLLIAKAFSLLSFGRNEFVAPLINTMSALASAGTVLFLFWTITHFARKILIRSEEEATPFRVRLVLFAGVIGALSYAFTDSFWFSAEEGEVYALSSLFTALVFWAMLKWEDVADEPHADRWLIFIAYMIGLSIGVHLLNLLTIPALVFIWYFRKHEKVTRLGLLLVGIISVLLLGGIQDVLIPGIVNLAGKTEILFVNKFHFGFNSGLIAFFVLLVALIVAGLFISHRKKIYWLNTTLLAFTVLLIGYSSFLVLVIRSQAVTPINEGNPSNPVSLLSYLNREQYGDWPLLYGPYFNAPEDTLKPASPGAPVYVKDEKSKRYIVSDPRRHAITNYDSRGCTIFPRMYNSGYSSGYVNWADVEGKPVGFTHNGQTDTINIPTFAENIRFFIVYQCGWMYARYFGWNFLGKQNDRTGSGGETEGNALIAPGLDDLRLGDQSLLPEFEKKQKARNRYYGIPFLLGIFGFIWHWQKSKRQTLLVGLLFFFTGFAIVLYLNQTPWQPRERDYAYVGSFYAYAIWIGFGAIAIFEFFLKWIKKTIALTLAAVFSFGSPLILFAQNIDDHNRSGRTVARDLAIDMLESCEKNAILFTYADNDTFPLWYAQEVLGVRRDVRVLCLSLLSGASYIDQAKRANYEAAPCPVTMDHWDYRDGTREFVNLFEETTDTMDAGAVIKFVTSNRYKDRFVSTLGDTLNYIPTRNLSIRKPNGDTLVWRLRGNYIGKEQLVMLDILAHNNWKRPIYFAVNMPTNCYAGLDNYLALEGIAYHLVPDANPREGGSLLMRPAVNLDKAYSNLMYKFRWGGLIDPKVYADETTQRMFSDPVRTSCGEIAVALAEAGRKNKAIDIIKLCTRKIPPTQVPPDEAWLDLIDAAYVAGDYPLAEELSRTAFNHFVSSIRWYNTIFRTPGDYAIKRDEYLNAIDMADEYGDVSLAKELRGDLHNLKFPVPAIPPPDSTIVPDTPH